MAKEITPERIERSYRRWMIFIWIYRGFLILYTGFLLSSMIAGQFRWIYLLYIALNALWWFLSIQWVKSARETRDSRYRYLQHERDFRKQYGHLWLDNDR